MGDGERRRFFICSYDFFDDHVLTFLTAVFVHGLTSYDIFNGRSMHFSLVKNKLACFHRITLAGLPLLPQPNCEAKRWVA
jgi:hypothetical protein